MGGSRLTNVVGLVVDDLKALAPRHVANLGVRGGEGRGQQGGWLNLQACRSTWRRFRCT